VTTAATASPTNRTTPSARYGRTIACSSIGMVGFIGARSMSAAVNTPMTPGALRASSTSMVAMRAWGIVDRTYVTYAAPGRRRLST
jgi:hypothetical protein